jgi:hypothetical protein
MQINLDHFHHWMLAVRQSADPLQTMEAFCADQMQSMEWLICELKRHHMYINPWPRIDIHGGWVGVLSSMLFQSDMYIKSICSIDIDPSCEDIARTMNQIEYESGRFNAVTADLRGVVSNTDIIINTCSNYITQEQYNTWLELQPNAIFVIQSNNYHIHEHVRITSDLDQFKQQSRINSIWSGCLETRLGKHWMIIGTKE